jgi:hypothetical protein
MAEMPKRQAPQKQSWTASWFSLPRLWVILGCLLPRSVREREFRPMFEELHEDYVVDLIELERTTTARRLSKATASVTKFVMNLVFAGWVAKLFAECVLRAFHKRE